MAKKRAGPAIIRSTESIALGSLANVTAIKLGSAVTLTEDFYLTATEVFCAVAALTAGEGEGLMLGIANGDLSVTEIQECLVVDGPVGLNDRVKTERAERFVKLFGAVGNSGPSSTSQVILGEHGGPMMKVNPKWLFTSDQGGWDFFIWNAGIALTTGATARLTNIVYGRWIV